MHNKSGNNWSYGNKIMIITIIQKTLLGMMVSLKITVVLSYKNTFFVLEWSIKIVPSSVRE